ncbi:DNA cytosine methyltransferase [Microbacterium aurantiacum]|uniref:DNA (cytosine-5-)-methyltransferase n=1 Tax=Microbacterium aurantiacum TaxID=162393 RepID=A0ABT8FRH7_9MICO|nr:DNA cytosine methyltransferase [Microbacterium aurantiacum]MDN4463918.1 DNA cytosine methyltransferase [Microbacterium aurantiacum]
MTKTKAQPIGYTHPAVQWNGLTVTDLFCGAGGSSSGLVEAGYRVVIAANHWARAIESHQLNHPETDHSQADISQVDPRYFPRTDVLWASPECTNHSIAKGVKRQQAINEALFELDGTRPLEDAAANRSRATMWDVPRFAEVHKYRAIIIENVVDAYRWIMFPAWLQAMELLGYRHEIVYLNSMHAQAGGLPAPQSRDRMYIVFWQKDTKRKPVLERWTRPLAICEEHGEVRAVQAFKKAERWGRYRAQYVYRCPKCGRAIEPGWLPALSIIDWTLPAPRIGDRAKPLADKTRERIRKGIERHWTPLVVKAAGNTYDAASGKPGNYLRVTPLGDALPTQSTSAEYGLALPPLVVNNVSGADTSRTTRATDPLPSLVAGGTHASLLIPVEGRDGKVAASALDPMRTQSTRAETALLVPYYGRSESKPATEPLGTVTTVDSAGLVVPLRNHGVAKPITHPIDTVSAEGNHHALLMRNNLGGAEMSTSVIEPMRTLTTGGHQSVIAPGEPISLDVDDAGFRMLEPHEIQLGMGFARDYVLLGSKREQVKQAGNAVTPPAARDLGHAVAAYLNGTEEAA